ncbi:hypothetical protein Syn7502_01481 [Synechococcus sp. PCC 7502]|uniref:hypothetical protein n=1 Tax=Synechococcus sp. PCC 7502 TaxID=1173263 RepID=UPI00029FF2EA|nr:hypothetical protein [Synechococcus sp. PCC 7502]AFY73549.1 hypothetical protein Syn7502_01481 [Synechococcus sp. PCC 7502]
MAKPLNIKPVQIYPSPELYDAIKETVDNGTYRSMNAAVIALVENALLGSNKAENNQSPVDIGTVKQLIKNEIAGLKQQLLDELSILIANFGSGQADNVIAIPETQQNKVDLTDIPATQAIPTDAVPAAVSPEITPDNPKPAQVSSEHPYPIGTEIRLKELSEHLGFNLINYSTYAKKQGITPDEYVNQRAITKGELWEIATVGNKKIATRVG